MVKLGVWQHHPAGMGMAGDSTMKNLFFNYKSQILRCAQNDSIILLRRKAGCSTSVESSLQISLFFTKRTQSGSVFNFAGTSSPVLYKGM
jgi:hypothetical protein